MEKFQGNGAMGLLPATLAAALFGWFLTLIEPVAAGQTLRVAWDWVPSMGVSLSFVVDGLSLTFALLISGIGALVMLYANTYLAGHPHYARFALFLTSFMLAMLGLVLADNLISLFVFWELTTVTSYLLIGFGHETQKGRRSALQALFVTGAGALALLAGFILLGSVAGSFELSEILRQGDMITSHPLYVPILILILAGTFTKSAQFPFHFWLPNAMAAPTPVSAYLHSATMVKAGVYLMARLYPAMSGTDIWFWTLSLAGAFTAVFASVLALRQTDLKQALAYTTLMALGTLTLFLGQDAAYAITAFATFLVVHSLYKAALFLVVGSVDHATGTREVDRLGGLGRAMPLTAFAAALAALSMAGLPPFLGFISKELKYAGILEAQTLMALLTAAVLVANALMFAIAGIVALRPFWLGTTAHLPRQKGEVPWSMVLGPVVLAILGTWFGLFPGSVQNTIIDPTVQAVTGGALTAKTLKLWAGVNVPLALSIATFVLGGAIYAAQRPLRGGLIRLTQMLPQFDNGWDRFLDGLKRFAAWQTQLIQNGVLRWYVFATFLTVLVATAAPILHYQLWPTALSFGEVSWKNGALMALIVSGALITAVTRDRIAAMAALGVVGIGVAMVFIVYGAPDVAITQLLVETLVVVLVAVALLRLPLLDPDGRPDWRPLDALLAVAVGAVVTVILLGVLEIPLDRRLSDYFESASWPDAYGRNIVNVILVDFRALDTFGEIAVVVIAALSAYALLRTTHPKGDK